MREWLAIATLFLVLASATIEPGHAKSAKLCKASGVGAILSDC